MATAMHSAIPQVPPTPFSRSNTSSSLGGFASLQSNATRSYDSSQTSALNTPLTSTPKTTRQNSNGYFQDVGSMNGSMPSYSRENSLRDSNGLSNYSQIYTAVYSGVHVYEMMVNSVAVMRRRSDGWLNATQILKVAGVEKGKRTKVLEKEILTGDHEKVQGGYGKYQGTWINYQRGVEFCRQYGVEEAIRPLLEYEMENGIPSQSGIETPTKEQAMAARRKRMYNGMDNRPGQSPSGTFFKNISSTASNAVAAIGKAQIDSPGSRPGTANVTRMDFPLSQQSMASIATDSSFGVHSQNDLSFSGNYFSTMPTQEEEPPRKKMRSSPKMNESFATIDQVLDNDVTMLDTSAKERSLQPMQWPNSKENDVKVQKLCTLFTEDCSDYMSHPVLQELSPEDLDLPLDKSCHTMLHWASTLANMPLIRALVAKGANIDRVNTGGETPLIRACLVTNALDQSCFPQMLEVFGATIDMRDNNDRTVLHHIALSSAVSGRSAASRYYLESLLEFVVRQGSNPSSQQSSFAGAYQPRPIGLGRFMSEIVNARDKSGDTALNIGARIGNRSIIQQLLEVKADATIANRAGLRPIDFGVGGEVSADAQEKSLAEAAREQASRAVGETSRDIMGSISNLLSQTEKEFAEEMATKQELIDSTHVSLREATKQLAEEKAKHVEAERESSARSQQRMKVVNLRRAVEAHPTQKLADDMDKETVRNLIYPNELPPEVFDKANAFSVTSPNPQAIQVTQKQFGYLSTLPSTAVLRARLQAYVRSRNSQQEKLRRLEERSSELERTYRKVVALCTGVDKDRVDELLSSLVVAVQSEKGPADVERVRGFLRRVEGVEA